MDELDWPARFAALHEQFGKPSNQHGETGNPTAGLIMMWDVSSQRLICFKLTPYKHEPEVALELCQHLPAKSLLITDRGFPSFELVHQLQDREQPFLLRITKTQWSAVKTYISSRKRDDDITIKRPNQARGRHDLPERQPCELSNIDCQMVKMNTLQPIYHGHHNTPRRSSANSTQHGGESKPHFEK